VCESLVLTTDSQNGSVPKDFKGPYFDNKLDSHADMSWLRDFIAGIKDAYKREVKLIIALIIVFIIIVGVLELYELIL
jgi:hypothetical protein